MLSGVTVSSAPVTPSTLQTVLVGPPASGKSTVGELLA
jgi:hypothetical protein